MFNRKLVYSFQKVRRTVPSAITLATLVLGDPARPTFEFIIEPPADPEFEALSKKHGTVGKALWQ